jgi:nicotinate dehydrogenase subunit A
METEFRLTVNGGERSVTCEPDTPLLDVLRHDLGLAGPKFGCGTGLCGACLVLIEGRARASCDLPVSAVGGPVTTLEGLPVVTAGFIRSSRRSSTSRPSSAVIAPPAW